MGVRMEVERMSILALMGMVQALDTPGNLIFESMSVMSSSQVSLSYQIWLSIARRNSGAQEEYQRGLARHWSTGFSTTVVSIIEKGAGSVEVSARPALPNTRSTSGKLLRTRSWVSRSFCASVTEIPGSVVGI